MGKAMALTDHSSSTMFLRYFTELTETIPNE